ncbi:SDR family NAD(P)-dependent oxidoreductase [Azospirillum agricola]|uniref:SDR family NAD(P)-dependent oxidoreductase n=1 Tax=Azospirillum agricola TaxID=1720247 RepID=UPI000A0F1571|nr:SDR family NAD(P)-dependent oxidoreductase [Azospirillum agricola]SMH38755.1 NAD(P)-dependent dehydrogenase, short-chain alcohol dehydrogenase family [Azospirillum lipoferum]
MKRLEGRRAIITGAGSGIGRASALRFAAEGASVLAVGRTEATIAETAALVREAGGVAGHFIADATKEEEVAAAVAVCVERLGGLEIFFANAGNTDRTVPLFDQTVEAWETQFRDNVVSAFLAVKHAGRHMVAQGHGSIVLNSSTGSLRANGGTLAYGAAKAGVNSLTMGAAAAFAGTGVRVNAVLPGLTETGLTRATFDYARAKGSEAKLGALTLMKRPGRVEEIAAVAAFLASDDAAYVDGQLIAADGGISSTHPYGRFVL